MEATAVSVGKAVLDGALGYAKSKEAEEIALQLGIDGDVDSITDELEMMQSFLMTADEERDQNKVLTTWAKQVRELAYNVEDSLMDFGLHPELEKASSRCFPRNLRDRRRIAMEVKELRAKVEEASSKNLRYRLIKESPGSKPPSAEEQRRIASAEMFGINEATLAAVELEKSKEKSKVDLRQLITNDDEDLRVIAVWGAIGDLGKASLIQEVYDDTTVNTKFGFRAWVTLMHPFDPKEFIQSLVRQFYENSPEKLGETRNGKTVGVNVLMKLENMTQSEIMQEFDAQVTNNSYLVVIDNLSTTVEWSCIKTYFPNKKKWSRIVVSTEQVEIACLCIEKPYQVSEVKQLSSDQTIYLFHKEVMPSIQEEDQQSKDAGGDEVSNSTTGKKLELLSGREKEQSEVINLVDQPDNGQGRKVISVWGMGGQGKTTLVRSVYRSRQLGGWKRAWATAVRPFNPEVLFRKLASDLLGASTQTATMGLKELNDKLTEFLKNNKCLIVLDDISSTAEWDLVKSFLEPVSENKSFLERVSENKSCLEYARRIIVTTREEKIAKHCSREYMYSLGGLKDEAALDLFKNKVMPSIQEEQCSREYKNVYSLSGLKDEAALELFKNKVFKDSTEKIDLRPDMKEQARLILKKCGGHPLSILTIGGFLATKPKTAIEWRKMNDRISVELEINPELGPIETVLMRCYDGLPYSLKTSLLHMSIFPEDHKIRRKRLVRRWIAEGYSRETHGMTAEEVGAKYFDELVDRSMILAGEEGLNLYSGKIDFCQLHDVIREICISEAREENLVFTLEEGCYLSGTQGAIRHLAISSSWKRDNKDVFESKLDLSHVRSLTVFGEWTSFFISNTMRFLQVLDLEDTIGLRDHDVDQIGELLHLKYLSLRGCHNIFHLPNSLGNLRHLQTLDVRDTGIFKLPRTITKLRNLQTLLADGLFQNPRGIGNLKALRTVGILSVYGKGDATIKELGRLTQLRKLEVSGMKKKNDKKFWSAIAGHNQLKSLSVRCYTVEDELDGCLGRDLSPPKCLESLKLDGKLVKVTEWIHHLRDLSKLQLVETELDPTDIQALGKLPNLAVLRLRRVSFVEEQLEFKCPSLNCSSFPSLMVLELGGFRSLKVISGLQFLTSLKEIQLDDTVGSELNEEERWQIQLDDTIGSELKEEKRRQLKEEKRRQLEEKVRSQLKEDQKLTLRHVEAGVTDEASL